MIRSFVPVTGSTLRYALASEISASLQQTLRGGL